MPKSGGPIGRREVLRWAAGVSRRDVTRLDDLKDGTVLLEVRPLPPAEGFPSSSSRVRWPGAPTPQGQGACWWPPAAAVRGSGG